MLKIPKIHALFLLFHHLCHIFGLLIFKNGGHLPPSWICYTIVWITHKEYMVIFIFVQNLFGHGAVVSIICQF